MNNIGLFSVPRSGSSWLGEIINSSPNVTYKFQPNFAYSFERELEVDSSTEEIDMFFSCLLKCNDQFVNGKISISGEQRDLCFEKDNQTTLLFKETHFLNIIKNLLNKSNTKIIGLVRSPFAVLNSWISTPNEFNPSWSIEDEWMTALKKNDNKKSHYFGYCKWKQACCMFLDFQKKYPNKFYLLRYENLIKNTTLEVKDLFDFCGLVFTNQTQIFLEKVTLQENKDAYSVFKNKKNDTVWQKKLPDYIQSKIINDPEFVELNKHFRWIL
jgi:hypothetical protein